MRRLPLLLAVSALVVAAVVAPASAGSMVNGKICIVNDIGGDENPWNVSAAEGAKATHSKLHVETQTLDAESEDELVANVDTFVTAGDCDLIIGLGFIAAFAMEPFITAHPGQDFVVVDFSFGGVYPNVAEVILMPNEAGFLAGYVAAGVSETGKIGVFGGLPIPPVTVFMDGYALGAEYYNGEYGTNVEVLGWDPDLQTGLFSFTFADPVVGQALASDLYDAGADTVFPVAGYTSFGALFEATDRKAVGDSVRVVGVDWDWSRTYGDPSRVILTSVIKDFGVAVFSQTAALVDGLWTAGPVFEGLESGAVDMSSFGKLTSQVPGTLKNDLPAIRTAIIEGALPTLP